MLNWWSIGLISVACQTAVNLQRAAEAEGERTLSLC